MNQVFGKRTQPVGIRCALVSVIGTLILCGFGLGHTTPLADNDTRTVTLLFTNDLESAYDPTPAFWRDDIDNIGGIAELATLVEEIRSRQPNVFLFDAGDIFTGTLSKLTQGELPLELMITLDYDAMAIGNHEFNYGWRTFAEQKNRVPFPVLGANLFYKGTDIPYAQPYSVIERNGIRIGVIGIMGQDAGTALNPANIDGVDVLDPKEIVPKYVRLLRPSVDIVVLLTHQGKTAPMQTDKEAQPDIQRGIAADIDLAGSVAGIDVLFGGHADAGTDDPVIHPDTGTIIMQTYGQGFHLGYLQLEVDIRNDKIVAYNGHLLTVDSDNLAPAAPVSKKLAEYRARFPDIYRVVGQSAERLTRKYNEESDIGNLFADLMKAEVAADAAFYPSGGIRKDLPAGDILLRDIMDAFPFTDKVVAIDLSGNAIREVLEQGLTLERGIMQVSGVKVAYDLERPPYSRVLSVEIGGEPLRNDEIYRIATLEIVANGGDLYNAFLSGERVHVTRNFIEVLDEYFASYEVVNVPESGRLLPQHRLH